MAVRAAINLLEQEGPTLGRPVVDRVKGSNLHNLKELRPNSTSIRILFIFDPMREAVYRELGLDTVCPTLSGARQIHAMLKG